MCLFFVKLTYILPGSSTASATGWWSSHLSIWSLGVFLLDVCVEGRVAQVSLGAVVALEVSSLYVVLGPSLTFTYLVVTAILVIVIILSLWLLLGLLLATRASHLIEVLLERHPLDLAFSFANGVVGHLYFAAKLDTLSDEALAHVALAYVALA